MEGIAKASKSLASPGHDPVPPLEVRKLYTSRAEAMGGFQELMQRSRSSLGLLRPDEWSVREEPSGIVVAEHLSAASEGHNPQHFVEAKGQKQPQGQDPEQWQQPQAMGGNGQATRPTLRDRLAPVNSGHPERDAYVHRHFPAPPRTSTLAATPILLPPAARGSTGPTGSQQRRGKPTLRPSLGELHRTQANRPEVTAYIDSLRLQGQN